MKTWIVTGMVLVAGWARASEGAPAVVEPEALVEPHDDAAHDPAAHDHAADADAAQVEPAIAAEPGDALDAADPGAAGELAAPADPGTAAEPAIEVDPAAAPPPAEPPSPAPRLRFVDLQRELARRLHPPVAADLFAPVPPPGVVADGFGLRVERRFGP